VRLVWNSLGQGTYGAPEAGLEPATRCLSEPGAPTSDGATEIKAWSGVSASGAADQQKVAPETVTETVTAQAALVSCGVGDRSATRSVERGLQLRLFARR
jgi:hypothetical protein